MANVVVSERQEREHFQHASSLPVFAGLLAAAACIRIIILSQNYYFFSDDFLNFVIVKDMGLSVAYFVRDAFGEFVPFFRTFWALYYRLAGVNFWPWVAFTCASISVILLLLELIFRSRRTSKTLAVFCLIVVAFSPVYRQPYEWPSTGIQVFPSTIAGLCLLLLAAKGEYWSWRRKLVACLVYASGSLFHPKTLSTIVLVCAVRSFVRSRDSGESTARSLLGAFWDVLPMLPIAVAYLWILHHLHYTSGVAAVGPARLLAYVWLGWTRGFISGTVGIEPSWTISVVAANCLAVGGMLMGIRRDWRTCFLWVGFLLYFSFTFIMIANNRMDPFGLESALYPRYSCDVLAYVLAFCGFAFSGTAGEGDPAPHLKSAFTAIPALALAVILMSAGQGRRTWIVDASVVRSYIGEVRKALKELPQGATIADTRVPPWIMPDWMYPLDQQRYFLTLFVNHPETASPDVATMKFNSEGKLMPNH